MRHALCNKYTLQGVNFRIRNPLPRTPTLPIRRLPTPGLLALNLLGVLHGSAIASNGDDPADAGPAPARTYDATRLVGERPTVDGRLDEELYAHLASTSGFTEAAPTPGTPADRETEVWLAYDDEALYVAARLSDDPRAVAAQVTGRDGIGQSDWFGVSVNPFRDGINAANFVVTAAGGQLDGRFDATRRGASLSRGDRAWDAVWTSAVSPTDDGWSVEMRIPLSMLRFPKGATQYWDVNFERARAATGQRYFWNAVDPRRDGAASQMGRLRNLRNLAPAPRLQLTPFVAANLANTVRPRGGDGPRLDYGTGFGFGADIKYGLSAAYTLDVTLVPDFSGARSDDQVLNLGPSEQRFGESREFFTEGVELFNKGGFFYSRRIGGGLVGTGDVALGDGERLDAAPARARLLNAAKVTGRSRSGLGVGVLNAVEAGEAVAIRNAAGEVVREAEAHPLTNYSVVSLDQNLPHNSFATLVNATTLRSGGATDANLTGLVWDVRNAAGRYAVSGKAGLSQRYGGEGVDLGHTYELTLAKIGGRLTGAATLYEESDTYDPNDLGFLGQNNERTARLDARYDWFEPVGPLLKANVHAGLHHRRLYRPGVATGTAISGGASALTRGFWSAGVRGYSDVVESHNYNEPRTPGRRMRNAPYGETAAWVGSDGREPLAVWVRAGYGREWATGDRQRVRLQVDPRWRVTDQLTFRLGGRLDARRRQRGYVGHTAEAVASYGLAGAGTNYRVLDAAAVGYEALPGDAIVVGERDVRTVELESAVAYAISPKADVNIRARHYWSAVEYDAFHTLSPGGSPEASDYAGVAADGSALHDVNFNAFNVDAFVRWRFAPGSDALLSYRTQANYTGDPEGSYGDNLGALGTEPVDNSLALKVVYWLDGGRWLRRRDPGQPARDVPDDMPPPAPVGDPIGDVPATWPTASDFGVGR